MWNISEKLIDAPARAAVTREVCAGRARILRLRQSGLPHAPSRSRLTPEGKRFVVETASLVFKRRQSIINSPRHLQKHTEGSSVRDGPSSQRATATVPERLEVKLDPCAQLSKVGSYTPPSC